MGIRDKTLRETGGAAVIVPALMVLCAAWALPCMAFQAGATPATSGQAEMTTRETTPAFQLKSERNLVVVRVVVRDSKGNALAKLRQDDFHLLDNGKPQVITHFEVETPETPGTKSPPVNPPANSQAEGEVTSNAASPHRYLALFFDDIHLRLGDLMRVKLAGLKYVNTAFLRGDLIGVFTSSGRSVLDFTDDPEKVRQAINQIFPHPVISADEHECPEIFDYQAYLMAQLNDQTAIGIANAEYFHCNCEQLGDPQAQAQCAQVGQQVVESDAMRELNIFETNTEAELRAIDELVRHLSAFPGQRTILLVSPGFLATTFETRLSRILDRALHANITVNTLDAKGLYAPLPGGDDMSKDPIFTPSRPDLAGQKERLRLTSIQVVADPLNELAAATGGIFFRNNNDLDLGFQICGALPEVYYILSYSPSNFKPNGQFHTINIKLAEPAGLSMQARRGYYAPDKSADPAVQAREEIRDAVYSPDEMNDLPIAVHTQFFRLNDAEAKLSVMTHVDLRFVHFQKHEGRNADNLTLVTVLFDENGRYVTAQEKTVEMHLRDSTLSRLSPTGITMKTSFNVRPGTYVVRQVVRDVEGAQLSGISRSVQIPF